MAETKKIEVGLGIGQVVSAKLTEEALSGFRSALEAGSGWYDLETEDGTVSLNLATVVFVKVADPHHSIGFSG
jgi:hypothetical protein